MIEWLAMCKCVSLSLSWCRKSKTYEPHTDETSTMDTKSPSRQGKLTGAKGKEDQEMIPLAAMNPVRSPEGQFLSLSLSLSLFLSLSITLSLDFFWVFHRDGAHEANQYREDQ